jgi:TonB family protein
MQANTSTLECAAGIEVNLDNANGEWSVTQDHPPCTVNCIVLQPVNATATEMARLKCRPVVSFQVAASGQVSDAKLLRSSGSTSLDEKALQQVVAHRYPRHNCCKCKVSLAVDVDFQGPVWMREPTRRRPNQK